MCELDGAGGKDGEGSATARRAIDYRAASGGGALSGGGSLPKQASSERMRKIMLKPLRMSIVVMGKETQPSAAFFSPWSLVFLLLPGNIAGRALGVGEAGGIDEVQVHGVAASAKHLQSAAFVNTVR